MRKEVVYAILAGISIGLIFAFGTWKITKLVKKSPAPAIKNVTPKPQTISTISIDSLKNYDVVNEDPTISGFTAPNTEIVIITNDSDYYVKSDNEGIFKIQISIPAGLSEVKIVDPVKNSTLKLLLVYSSEVESGLTSFVGTVTDISSGNLQIKIPSGGISQVSMGSEANIINTLKKNAVIKESDLAIGDYVVAIGKMNSSKVLQAQRILVTSPIQENKYIAEKITIEKLSKTKINDITLPKKWVGPNIKELSEGQQIIIVGSKDDENYTLRSIFSTVE